MGRKYRDPPIVEAVCEFRFEPSAPWDLTIPGLIYEKLKEDFHKKRPVKLQELRIETSPAGFEQTFGTSDGMRFLREDEKTFIQVAQNILSANHVKPYSNWESFLPFIHQAFETYKEVAKPNGIRRIGLRYINRIEIPGSPIKIEDYLHFYPFVASHLPQMFGNFLAAIETHYDESRDILKLQAGSAPVQTPGRVGIILDLDYFLTQPGGVPMDSVFEWVALAHDRVEEVFEGCITDLLREMFEEVKA